METKIVTLKSTLIKSRYGSEVNLFKYYRNFDTGQLKKKHLGAEIVLLNTNKDFQVYGYDEKRIEDAVNIIAKNGKTLEIISYYSTKFIYLLIKLESIILFVQKIMIIFQF